MNWFKVVMSACLLIFLAGIFGEKQGFGFHHYFKCGLIVAVICLCGAFVYVFILRLRVKGVTSELSLKNKELNKALSQMQIAEHARRDSDNRFYSFLHAFPEGIAIAQIVYDLSGKPLDYVIKEINESFSDFTGFQRDQVVGRKSVLAFSTNKPPFLDLFAEVARSGASNQFETIFGPLRRFFRITVFSQSPGQFAAVLEDITETKSLERQLVQAQKMQAIGTLAGGIAHDFNNILYAISGFTELCLEDAPTHSEHHNNLEEISIATKRASDLVNRILTFSHQTETQKKPIEIRYIIKEALKLLRATIPSNIEIRPDISKREGNVMADPTQIHQIVMNLCTNAAHAMQEKGGVLKVVLRDGDLDLSLDGNPQLLEPGPYMELIVSDTGHAMTPDVEKRIFEPYFTTKKQGEGTGLGLSMVHGIVKDLQGAIRIDSKPGSGTTCKVFFPRIETQLEQDMGDESLIPGGSENILVVDDEQMLVNMTSAMLKKLGYNVTSCISSVEALKTIQKNPSDFDLVVMDQTMPHMTGKELAEKIQHIRPEMPIVLCTGFSASINEEKALSSGIAAFIKKPISRTALAKTLRRLIDDSKKNVCLTQGTPCMETVRK